MLHMYVTQNVVHIECECVVHDVVPQSTDLVPVVQSTKVKVKESF